MTARREKVPPPLESCVYLGRNLAGSIVVETKGVVRALDANGRRIGTFKTASEAMAAILDKAREGGT